MRSAQSLFAPGPRCFPEAPDIGGCDPCCQPVCEPRCCPPKARARDAIFMKPREIARNFVLSELGCDPAQIPMIVAKVAMNLRRRGLCNILQCLSPSQTNLDGSVTFQWPDCFLEAPPGQFEGDIFINGCEVGTVLLVKPDQKAVIVSPDATQENHPCGTCGSCLPSCGCQSTCGPICGDFPDLVDQEEIIEPACGACAPCP